MRRWRWGVLRERGSLVKWQRYKSMFESSETISQKQYNPKVCEVLSVNATDSSGFLKPMATEYMKIFRFMHSCQG